MILELFPHRQHVEFVQIVERHLVPITSKKHYLVSDYNSVMPIPSTRSLTIYHIAVVN